MYITLNIVLDYLREYNCDFHGKDLGKRQFRRLAVLPPEHTALYPDRLYVGLLSQILDRKDNGTFCCICLRDRIQDECETEEKLFGHVVVNSNIEILSLISMLEELFFRLSEWQHAMRSAVFNHQPLQAVLDLSEPIIGNFMSVTDSAMALLAYTRNISTDDAISLRLIEKGYHPVESTEIFRSYDPKALTQESDGFVLDSSHTTSAHDLVSKVFRFHGTYYAQCVMTCNNRPASPGLLDMFRMLGDALELFMEYDQKQKSSDFSSTEELLTELLQNRIANEAILRERSSACGIHIRGRFRLLTIRPDMYSDLQMNRIGMQVTEIIPSAFFTAYQRQVVLLQLSAEENRDAELSEKLADYLSREQASCGISAVYENLSDTGLAYSQTRLALKYRLDKASIPGQVQKHPAEQNRIFYFESRVLQILAGESGFAEPLWRSIRGVRLLEQLNEYDRKHGTDNLKLLYTFLLCESHAVQTGELLYMHRNNVLYHIGRIEDILGIDLSEAALKHELLESCMLLQVFGLNGKE